jgi:hypothetical protein
MSVLMKSLLAAGFIWPSFGVANDGFGAVIHQSILSREVLTSADETEIQVSEMFERLSNEMDCSQFDLDGEYSSYRLEIVTQRPSQRNAAAFTQWFEGVKSEDTIVRVTIQTCFGLDPLDSAI